MARLKAGIFGPIVGRIANLVGYERLGQSILRKLPQKNKRKKARTDAQKAVNLRFKLITSFISAINDFTNVGFKQDVAGTTKIAQNNAVSYNLKAAIAGEYPDFAIDYTKAIVSKGKLPSPVNPEIEYENNVLKFKWDVDSQWNYIRNRDQVMLLAYLPANNKAQFSLSGARRLAGEDALKVYVRTADQGGIKKDTVIETYIAFISDDRQSISDSVYAGRIILP